ncbi:818_t:CDS:2, partial [Ambispora gerdemannii]
PLVNIKIDDRSNTGINIPNMFVCGQNVKAITVEKIPRGSNAKAELIPNYQSREKMQILESAGDWVTEDMLNGPCFLFQPNGNLLFQPSATGIDYISINVLGDLNSSDYVLFGLYNNERNISQTRTYPFRRDSVNSFTFSMVERIKLSGESQSEININMQNSFSLKFEAQNIALKFNIYPNQYNVIRFTEQQAYTTYDLVSAIGGDLTFVVTSYVILFGSGKYKSWGIVQRYFLRNAPNAKKVPRMERVRKSTNDSFPSENFLNKNSPPPFLNERVHSEYYFSESRSEIARNAMITGEIVGSPMSEISFSRQEFNERVNALIDEKFWFLEQT